MWNRDLSNKDCVFVFTIYLTPSHLQRSYLPFAHAYLEDALACLIIHMLVFPQQQVDVTTGAMRGSGTDARVGIILYGKDGDSGERFLDHSLTHR